MDNSSSNVILVTGSYDQTLIFWNAIEGNSLYHIDYPEKQIINRIEISTDKVYLGAACSNSIKIYDLVGSANSTPTHSFDGFTSNVTAIGFQKDCNWIFSGSEDGSVRISDLRASGYQRIYSNRDPINTVAIHPNEAELIAGDQTGNIKIFDLVADKCRATFTPSSEIGIRSISIASNASCLVAADSAGVCHVWTLKDGEELIPLQKFEAHNDYILKCLISIDMKYLATCSADKTVKLYQMDQEKGFVHNRTIYGHSRWVWDCAFSCDSEFLITVSTDGIARIWQTDTGDVIKTLKGHKKGINCVALNDL